MSRGFWAGALLLVSCGGGDDGALFGDPGETAGGGATTVPTAGTGGDAEPMAGAPGEPTGGSIDVSPAGGSAVATAGMPSGVGGASAQAGTSGAGGLGGSVGGGGAATGGSHAGQGGSSGGKPSGGAAGGGSDPLECQAGSLDCTDAPGCETDPFDVAHCGACEIKCGVTQQCAPGKATGKPVCLAK